MGAIEPLRETIDQIETSLRSPEVSDQTLIQHRGRLEPVRDELREIITSLEGRLEDVETRLKQLGEAPDEGEPKEDPNLTAERTRLEERRTALDGAVKQTRLLMLRADNLSVRITERRRALFTQELLGRTSSALDPAFWAQAAKAAPDAFYGVQLVAQGWMDHLRATASTWKIAAASIALLVFFACAGLFLRWFMRRDFRPKELGTRFAKSFFALISLIRVTVTAPAVRPGRVADPQRLRPPDRAGRQYRSDAGGRDRGRRFRPRRCGRPVRPGRSGSPPACGAGRDGEPCRLATDLGRAHSRRGHLHQCGAADASSRRSR